MAVWDGSPGRPGDARERPSTPGRRWWTLPAAALLIVLGIKLLLIGLAGSPAPFWDQWDGEGLNLIGPYLDGTLHLSALLAPHNEHRILFTRLLTLGLLEINGSWDPVGEMIAGAFLHVGALAAILWLLRREGVAALPSLVAVLLLLAFAFPFSIANTLCGFQSQFYFLLLLSAAGVMLVVSRPALSGVWWLGTALVGAAILAMASGLLAPVAALTVSAAQMALRARPRSPREAGGLVLLGAILAAQSTLLTSVEGTQTYRASGLPMFLSALAQTGGWPVTAWLLSPLLLNAPVLALGWVMLRGRVSYRSPGWRTVALFAWVGGQCLSTAYMRASEPLASRYLDIFAVLILVNGVALAALATGSSPTTRPSRMAVLGASWVALIAVTLLVQVRVAIRNDLPLFIGADPRDREASLAGYLQTGDLRAFNRPLFHTPYPDAARLAMILADPAIRGVLPVPFAAGEAERDAVRRRLRLGGGLRLASTTTSLVARLLGSAALALGLGFIAFRLAYAQLATAQRARSSHPRPE